MHRILFLIFLCLGLFSILALTLYPFSFGNYDRLMHLPSYFHGLQLPVYDTGYGYLQIVEPVANIILFVPFGLGLAGQFTDTRKYIAGVFLAVLAASMTLSFLVECMQVFLPGRSPSLLDISMNTIGGALGAGIQQLYMSLLMAKHEE